MSDDQVTVWWEPLTEDQIAPTPPKGAAMRCVEYLAHGMTISECRECFHWSAHVDIVDGDVIVREWHKPECSTAEVIRQMCARCHDTVANGRYCPECGLYSAEEPDS
ncbi:hypothetical protein ACTHAM_002399 [Cellulomonas soli]|uniref:hypothetical protein n=1 Tax=Cellulomonas soli TaxID=931535 RepID=UPI003F874C50